MESWLTLLGGIGLLVYGIWSLIANIQDTKRGYRSEYAGDLKLYFSSILAIILGIVLICKEVL